MTAKFFTFEAFSLFPRLTGQGANFSNMGDIFERLLKNYGPIGQHREKAHGYFAFPKLEGEIGSRMKFRGKEMIVWSLNNYLGLANHPDVRKADAAAAAAFGLAYPMGARMMSGNSNAHEQLEQELAAFVQKEDSILLNFGYQGMVSLVEAGGQVSGVCWGANHFFGLCLRQVVTSRHYCWRRTVMVRYWQYH